MCRETRARLKVIMWSGRFGRTGTTTSGTTEVLCPVSKIVAVGSGMIFEETTVLDAVGTVGTI